MSATALQSAFRGHAARKKAASKEPPSFLEAVVEEGEPSEKQSFLEAMIEGEESVEAESFLEAMVEEPSEGQSFLEAMVEQYESPRPTTTEARGIARNFYQEVVTDALECMDHGLGSP